MQETDGFGNSKECLFQDEDDEELYDLDPLPTEPTATTGNNSTSAAKKIDINNLYIADIFKNLWKTVESAEEKNALLIFQIIFQIVIQVVSIQIEEWIKDRKAQSLNKNTVLALIFIRIAFQRDYLTILIPCFFRIMIIKAGISAKFYASMFLKK